MTLDNLLKPHTLVGFGILAVVASASVGCGDDSFTGCAASRTCPEKGDTGGSSGAGGEGNADAGGAAGGGSDNGGSSGSGGASGSSAAGEGGEGGRATGGTAGTSGEGGETTGGTSGSAGSGGEGGGSDPTDRPTIVSVYPADGATGVRSDENIVITFNEPMDHASTEAAFQSTELVPASFSWNGSSTVVTINPSADLFYAEGTDPGVRPREYAVRVANTAEDEAGNRLAADFEWTFQTLRRVTQTLQVPFANVRVVNSTSGAGSQCTSSASAAYAGDAADNSGNFILVSADISVLPAGATLESGTLSGDQTATEDEPYALGVLRASAINVHPPTSATWGPSIPAGSRFSDNETLERKTANIGGAVVQDYAERVARNNLSQYRVGFDTLLSDNNNNADIVVFRCGSFSLTVAYVLP